MTEIERAMPYKPENLEALIDNILQDEGPMTLADLIDVIARPQYPDGFRPSESAVSKSVTLDRSLIENEQSAAHAVG